MSEETYFYRAGQRRELEKAPGVIGISFLRGAPPPEACALPEGVASATSLRRLAYLRRARFGVFCLDPQTPRARRGLLERRDRAMEALREVDRTAFVSHAYRTDPRAEGAVLVLTDEIVAETPELTLARLRALLSRRGLRHVRVLDAARRVHVLRVTSEAGVNALKAANRLVEEGIAAAAEPNFVRRLPYRGSRAAPSSRSRRAAAAARTAGARGAGRERAGSPKRPTDPLFAKQWHLENAGRGGARRGADVRALAAWEVTMGDPEVVVAIVDDGVDLDHREFATKGKVRPGWNFQDGNDDPAAPPGNRHGTACAGIAVAASGNRSGGCGVAPRCSLLPVRTPDEWGDEVGYADAVAWAADHGAHVISCSWGPPDAYWSEDPLPLAMDAVFEHATTKARDGLGAVIVWAAGNGNEPIDLDGFASDPRVIAVAASDDRDRKASYGDFGRAISVCAPSGDDLRGRPGIWTTDLSGRAGYARGDYTSEFSGTSAAAPLVAGVAALVLSVHARLGWRDVKSLLEQTAARIDAEGSFTDARGKAHPAEYADGRSLCYGAGRVDAAAAVRRARELAGGGAPAAQAPAEGSGKDRAKPARRGLHYHRAGKRIPLRSVPTPEAERGRPVARAYVAVGGDSACVLIPTGQVVVQFAPDVTASRAREELATRGARVVRRLEYLPNGFLAETRPQAALELANELHEQPFVVAAEPNWRRRTRKR